MIHFIIAAAIFIAIAIGFKTRINTGFIAIGFAYLIGSLFLDLKAHEIIDLWPINLFFIIFGVSIFYGFALTNGTLEKLAHHFLYHTRRFPNYLPITVYFATTLLAGMGAGYLAVLAFFTPVTMMMCDRTGTNKLVGAIAVNFGALAGGNFITSSSGIVIQGLLESSGVEGNLFSYTGAIFLASFIVPMAILALVMFLFPSVKTLDGPLEVDYPEPLSRKQKQTIALIVVMISTVLIIPTLSMVFPDHEIFNFIADRVDISLLALFFAMIAFLLRLGDQEVIIQQVPWSTIIMVCGIGMMIGIAKQADSINLLSSWIGEHIPFYLIPIVICLVAGIMSFFSSALGVVAPALFPTVPLIAAASGLSPTLLFIIIVLSAQATIISPFSSGGSLILSAVKQTERVEMFDDLATKAAPLSLLVIIGAVIILSLITFL